MVNVLPLVEGFVVARNETASGAAPYVGDARKLVEVLKTGQTNWQLGPVRPTNEPSEHCIASAVHATEVPPTLTVVLVLASLPAASWTTIVIVYMPADAYAWVKVVVCTNTLDAPNSELHAILTGSSPQRIPYVSD